jgi:Uma2 family endonuclease
MATNPTGPVPDSGTSNLKQFEKINGGIRPRVTPDAMHEVVRTYCMDVLRLPVDRYSGRILADWSLANGDGDWLVPDIMVSTTDLRMDPNGSLLVPPPPYLVIEIRSPGENLIDLFDKANIYHESYSVPYYWIIDPIERGAYEMMMLSLNRAVRAWPKGPTQTLQAGIDVSLDQNGLWQYVDNNKPPVP